MPTQNNNVRKILIKKEQQFHENALIILLDIKFDYAHKPNNK